MRIARSDYLWFAVRVTAGAEDPLWLLQHSLPSPFRLEGTLGLAALPGFGLRVSDRAGVRRQEFDSAWARAEHAYAMVHRTMMDRASAEGWVGIRAAQVDLRGTRILIAGPPGTGKTTLALGLAARGGTIGSDEVVLLREGHAVALPRRLRLLHDATTHLPERARESAVELPYAPPVDAVDPGRLTPSPPLVAPRVPKLLVLLTPGTHDPIVSEASPLQVIAELSTGAAPMSPDRGKLIGELSRLQRNVRCVRLTGRADDHGVDALESLV